MAPRYTVSAWQFGKPRQGPVCQIGTEEVEATLTYMAKQFPKARISVLDEYARTVYIHQEWKES